MLQCQVTDVRLRGTASASASSPFQQHSLRAASSEGEGLFRASKLHRAILLANSARDPWRGPQDRVFLFARLTCLGVCGWSALHPSWHVAIGGTSLLDQLFRELNSLMAAIAAKKSLIVLLSVVDR